MGTSLEDLRMLQDAEAVADGVWQNVVTWKPLAQEVVGSQLARAADSIGANIAEAFGRYHYGEKLRFLYYARGSLFETKYWLNRALKRQLMASEQTDNYANQLDSLARQLNAFINSLKSQRHLHDTLREVTEEYLTNSSVEQPVPVKDDVDSVSNLHISNLHHRK